jgi:signal transduction histidine kinase
LVALAERAGSLAKGDFTRRVPRKTSVAEMDELAVSFNRLADELQARLSELGRERDEMRALIDTMAEGVVALTEDARILRINRAARVFLAVPEPLSFAPVGTLIRHHEIRELLEESVVRAVSAREVRIGDRYFIVTSRLLDRGGSVITFLEVSEIRRLEQVRRDFVANVSHELKTPLTSIRGFVETLLEDEPPEPLRRQFLENVRRNTLRLQRLVDDLLDLSRLEAGRWQLELQPVEVAAAARESWQALETTATERGVAFAVEGSAVAMADDQALAQVFQNLFDNALRYTSDGGSVRVTLEAREETVHVAVADTGSGIPARSLPRIFERFYRVDPARSREEGGTGLGLAIVRHLVQGMGGEVTAESELGRGSVIRFTLPASSETRLPEA